MFGGTRQLAQALSFIPEFQSIARSLRRTR
jgi:hypothetical protein